MKPRFEEHKDQLFRMLEEPVPLTPDAEMPCLVQLIQDDSPMGRNNKNRFISYIEQKFIIKELDVGKYVEIDELKWFFPARKFEIIGYPVVEGSKDWALYQMMQGEKVFRVEWKCDMYCQYTNNEIITFRYGISSTINPVEEWIANAKRADFGWKIYKEPKIEPPKEPDYVICKRCGGTGYEIKEQKPDNLYLNIKTSTPVNWCFDKENLLVLVDDNFTGIVGENVTQEQVGEIAKLLTEPAKEQEEE